MKGKEHPNIQEACLQWVYVGKETHHVSEFASLKPVDRPTAFCPICRRNVILKLGTERVHHAAHYEGSICAATQPETVIHLNAKYYLQKILREANSLKIWQSCNGWIFENYQHVCYNDTRRETCYVQGWDRVEVEWNFGKYRLDVALLNNDQVIGGIEILVTHKSEEEKIAFLNHKGIAWAEVRVTPEFYTVPAAWTPKSPLVAERINLSAVESWHCAYCISSLDKHRKSIEENRRLEEKREKRKTYARQFETFQTMAARLIDFYYPSGKKYRSVFVIQNKLRDGKVLCAELQEIGTQRRTIARELPPLTEESYRRLRDALNNESKQKEQRNIIIDDGNPWMEKPKKFHPKKFLNPVQYPYKYELSGKTWKKVENQSRHPTRISRHHFIPGQSFFHEKSEVRLIEERPPTFMENEYPCEKCGKITSDWISAKHGAKTCICRECAYK
jgi:hypothetical protein